MSRIFLHSPIDRLGYLDDPTFHITIHRYLGLPCPLLRGYEGYKFGKDGTEVDVMGANLASAALPGSGFFPLHNDLQSFLEECFKTAGLAVSKENANFLEGLVPEGHLKEYRDYIHSFSQPHKAPGAIIPDLDTPAMPVHNQTSPNGADMCIPAVFEVKTMQYKPRSYGVPINTKAQRPAE